MDLGYTGEQDKMDYTDESERGGGRTSEQETCKHQEFISALKMNNFITVLQLPKAITFWKELATVRFISPPS